MLFLALLLSSLEKLGGVVIPHLLHLLDGLRLPVPSSETFPTFIICYNYNNIHFYFLQARICENNYVSNIFPLFHQVSKPEELPLKFLSEPCLTVSHHTAPSYLAVGVAPNFQCANIFEFSFAILSNHFVALFLEFLFLYFLLTHLIKHLFMYLSILYIAVL